MPPLPLPRQKVKAYNFWLLPPRKLIAKPAKDSPPKATANEQRKDEASKDLPQPNITPKRPPKEASSDVTYTKLTATFEEPLVDTVSPSRVIALISGNDSKESTSVPKELPLNAIVADTATTSFSTETSPKTRDVKKHACPRKDLSINSTLQRTAISALRPSSGIIQIKQPSYIPEVRSTTQLADISHTSASEVAATGPAEFSASALLSVMHTSDTTLLDAPGPFESEPGNEGSQIQPYPSISPRKKRQASSANSVEPPSKHRAFESTKDTEKEPDDVAVQSSDIEALNRYVHKLNNQHRIDREKIELLRRGILRNIEGGRMAMVFSEDKFNELKARMQCTEQQNAGDQLTEQMATLALEVEKWRQYFTVMESKYFTAQRTITTLRVNQERQEQNHKLVIEENRRLQQKIDRAAELGSQSHRFLLGQNAKLQQENERLHLGWRRERDRARQEIDRLGSLINMGEEWSRNQLAVCEGLRREKLDAQLELPMKIAEFMRLQGEVETLKTRLSRYRVYQRPNYEVRGDGQGGQMLLK